MEESKINAIDFNNFINTPNYINAEDKQSAVKLTALLKVT
jgi:hypothetical protein